MKPVISPFCGISLQGIVFYASWLCIFQGCSAYCGEVAVAGLDLPAFYLLDIITVLSAGIIGLIGLYREKIRLLQGFSNLLLFRAVLFSMWFISADRYGWSVALADWLVALAWLYETGLDLPRPASLRFLIKQSELVVSCAGAAYFLGYVAFVLVVGAMASALAAAITKHEAIYQEMVQRRSVWTTAQPELAY